MSLHDNHPDPATLPASADAFANSAPDDASALFEKKCQEAVNHAFAKPGSLAGLFEYVTVMLIKERHTQHQAMNRLLAVLDNPGDQVEALRSLEETKYKADKILMTAQSNLLRATEQSQLARKKRRRAQAGDDSEAGPRVWPK